jgi:DNA-binding beta-propeller fold protein YncE
MATKKKMLQAAAGAGADSSTPWDISSAVYNGSPINWVYIASQGSAEGLSFKGDGTKMYTISGNTDNVNEYDLSTAWDITTASHVQSFNVGGSENNPHGLFFKPDGTEMYIVGQSNDRVFQYTLSTAWDISTASSTTSVYVGTWESYPTDLFLSPDGTKMYVCGTSGQDVNEFTLSTAWAVNTASYTRNFSVTSQEIAPEGLFFKSDGTKMYIVGKNSDTIYEYSLSTAWNLSTAVHYTTQVLDVNSQELAPTALFIKPDGSEVYMGGTVTGTVYKYDLSTAWDISTASFTYPSTDYFNTATQDNAPQGLFIKPDGTKMYVMGYSTDSVHEYNLSIEWDISTASHVQGKNITAQEGQPRDLFFKPDGTKMYIIGTGGDEVNEFTLSTAWDISTASYAQLFSVNSQDSSALGLFFKPDGTKMYMAGAANDSVFEYNLSTAWDISTASYSQSFSIAAQALSPQALSFKDDGTKMYVTGSGSDAVNEYELSTAWDVSTASYVEAFSVARQESVPTGLFFKDDGAKMYICGLNQDAILSYDL